MSDTRQNIFYACLMCGLDLEGRFESPLECVIKLRQKQKLVMSAPLFPCVNANYIYIFFLIAIQCCG